MAERQQNYFDVVTSAMDRMKHVENYIRTGIAVSKDLAQDFLEINKDDSAKQLDQLRDTLLHFLKMEADINNFSKTIENTRIKYASGDLPDDLGRQVTEAFHSINPPTAETLKSHQQFKDFELTIHELMADPAAEGVSTQVVIEEGDMVMIQENAIPLDPISKQEITDPVRNIICGHSYQRNTITQHMANRKARCPMVGCNNNKRLQPNHLQDDHALKNLIERKNKAAERAKRLM